jgi:hypothetical protein
MLCDKAVYLKNGSLDSIGETNGIINNYLNDNKAMYEKNNSFDLKNHILNTDYYIKYFSLNPSKENSNFLTSENVDFFVNIIENKTNKSAIFCVKIYKDSGEKIFTIYEKVTNIYKNDNKLDLKFKISISKNILSSGNYYVDIDIHIPGQMILQSIESINHFSILDDNSSYKIYPFSDNGLILPQYEISII